MWQRTLVSLLALAAAGAAPSVRSEAPRAAQGATKGGPRHTPLEDELDSSRYLKEIFEELKADPRFKNRLVAMAPDALKTGNIAEDLDFVSQSMRNRLSDIKRREYKRLKQLWKQLNGEGAPKRPDHMDMTEREFTKDDLRKLILKSVGNLQAVDDARRAKFRMYEMQKESDYRKKLVEMSAEEKSKAEAEHAAKLAKHKQHPKLHQPGHKAQLKEVWEEEDHMRGEVFEPKAFFALHDINGDGAWDAEEVEALFEHELKKMYDKEATEDDMLEKEEDMERMREQLEDEMDLNRDMLVSRAEFLAFTRSEAFERDEGFRGVEYDELDEEELRRFERGQMQWLRAMAGARQYPGV